MQIQAISFDLDDTLWPVAPVIHRAEARMQRWLVRHFPRTQYVIAEAPTVRRAVLADFPARAHDLTFVRKQVLARLARAAGYGDALVEPAFAVFDAWRNEVELFADVDPVLPALAARWPLVALTNGNASLQRTGTDPFFVALVNARAAGAAKPDRRPFELAAERAGTAIERLLHVGDHPEHDVEGARRAGAQTIWLNRDGVAWPGEPGTEPVTVPDLAALKRVLDAR